MKIVENAQKLKNLKMVLKIPSPKGLGKNVSCYKKSMKKTDSSYSILRHNPGIL